MTNVSSRKNLVKDLSILLVLMGSLLALPWLQSLLEREAQVETSVVPESADGNSPANPEQSDLQQDKAFIATLFPTLSAWQAQELEPYLAEETKNEDWSAEVASVLDTLSARLGQLERFSEPEPVGVNVSPDESLASYEFVAFYESGAADVSIVLSESDGQPHLYSFDFQVHNES